MQFPQAVEGVLLDSVDVVLMKAQLYDVGGQISRDLRQQVVGEVQQSQVVHVLEGIWVNFRDPVVDQKQALFGGERKVTGHL